MHAYKCVCIQYICEAFVSVSCVYMRVTAVAILVARVQVRMEGKFENSSSLLSTLSLSRSYPSHE